MAKNNFEERERKKKKKEKEKDPKGDRKGLRWKSEGKY